MDRIAIKHSCPYPDKRKRICPYPGKENRGTPGDSLWYLAVSGLEQEAPTS